MTAPSVGRLPGRTGTTTVVVAFVVLSACAVLFAFSPTLNPLDILTGSFLKVPVPDVRGLTQERALVELQRSQLEGDVEFVYSANVDRNKVVSEFPKASSTIRRHSVVKVLVSRGPALFTLPDFTGVPERQVRETLSAYDIKLAVKRVSDEVVRSGSVISQSPRSGVVAIGGSTVSVNVSTGPVVRVVPDVAGLTTEGAAYRVGKAGFVLGALNKVDSSTVPIGGVIGADPPAGTKLARDTVVNLSVSAGPAAIPVPKVSGTNRDAAASALSALGFVVAEVSQPGILRDPLDGRVVSQVPAEATPARPGSIVTITVRRAMKPPPTSSPATIPPPTLAPTIPPTTTTTTTLPPSTTAAPTTLAPVPGA